MEERSRVAVPSEFGSQPVQAVEKAGPRAAAPTTPDRVQITAREVQAELNDPRLVMLHEPDSQRAATYRVLRHRLAERGGPRTVLVSSAEAKEGKTTLAANLALSMSECGRARVLLIEANLRRPGLAQMLGFRPPRCFAEQVASHRDNPTEPWVVAQVQSPWLHVAAVDEVSFTPQAVIDGPALEGAIAKLQRVQYDYLVLDSPPVLGHADVNLAQDTADAVVLAVWSGKTSSRALHRAIDQITDAKLAGLVLLEV